ncbi:MAG: fimbrillin family protein [Alistipes sp.]|nr:fimbrillin family protein [Alistipes sp.]
MKKLFFAAIAGAALASCVSNEAEIAPKADSRISFAAPLVSSITRVYEGEISNPYPNNEKFTVFAKYYPTTFSTWTAGEWYIGTADGGVDVAYNASLNGWAPDGTEYYWPKNGSLTFYAYSPADYESWKPAITASEQMQATAVSIPADAADVDLLYSELAKDKHANDNIENNNGNSEYYGVELKFKHALSSIQFKVKLDSEYKTDIKLNKIELKQAKSEGTFSWTLSADENPTWEALTAPLDYTVVSGIDQIVTTVDTAEAVAQAVPMILLPQTLTDVVAEVTYTIDGRESTTDINLSELKHGEQAAAEWQPGKRYIYTITFSLKTIYFDPTVSDWDTVEVSYPKSELENA